MDKKVEYRQIRSGVRASRSTKGDPNISGYCALFNVNTLLGGFMLDFTEIVKPGAFAKCLASNPDIRCLWNHSADWPLGRTTAKTLSLNEDARGLYFSCSVADTQMGRDVVTSIERGDCTGASIGFQVNKQNWIDEKQADGTVKTTRELLEVELLDAGPVTFPAVEQTSVEAVRSMLWPAGLPDEVRARTERRGDTLARMRARSRALFDELGLKHAKDDDELRCKCGCEECVSGNCDECTDTKCDDPNCEDCPNQQRSKQRLVGRTIFPPGADLSTFIADRDTATQIEAARRKMRMLR